jgi:hypothetical protein
MLRLGKKGEQPESHVSLQTPCSTEDFNRAAGRDETAAVPFPTQSPLSLHRVEIFFTKG